MTFAAKCTCAYSMSGLCNGSVKECRNKIAELKIYKPLKELTNSEEDCYKIFNFVTEGYGENIINNIEYRDDCVLIESRVPSDDGVFIRGVFIVFDGCVEHYNYHEEDIENRDPDLFFNRHDNPIENIFALVDFIRQLGYEPQTK